MTFYKMLSALIITLSVFSSNVSSMQNDLFTPDPDDNTPHVPYRLYDQPEEEEVTEDLGEQLPLVERPEETDKNCSHWGLSHWFSGIGEYLQTCLCCKVNKKEGLYRHTIESDTYWSTGPRPQPRTTVVLSDCYFNYFNTSYSDPRRCDKAFCCFPFAAMTHLCCLPFACCKVAKSDPEEIFHRGNFIYCTPLDGPEEERARARAGARCALEFRHNVCTNTNCLLGQPGLCPKIN
jgi:hypothetical protein